MGTVYECLDQQLEKIVAVKVLAWSFSSNKVSRFQKEARLLAQLQHPNILSIRDFGYSNEGGVFLVTDLVSGKTLEDILSDVECLPVEEAIPVFIQICDGLAHAHNAGILHRDIKASNIMIAPEDDRVDVIVMDFGFAKLIDDDQKLTSAGVALGTPAYVSPEQADCQPVDVQSDVYSLGCTMFEVLTGKVPYAAKTIPATLLLHMTGPIPRLTDKAPDMEFPECIEIIVAKCLAKSMQDRYQTMEELREALVAAQNELQKTAADVLLSGFHSAGDDKSIALTPEEIKRHQRNIIVLVACLFVSIGILAFVCLNSLERLKLNDIEEPKKKAPTGLSNPSEYLIETELSVKPHCNDEMLKNEIANKKIEELSIAGSRVSDAGIEYICKLPLTSLNASRTQVSDAGLKSLATISTLEVLDLTGCTNITVKGLAALSNLHSLNTLSLGGTSLQGIESLQKLPLTNLTISHSPLSDETLKSISMLPSLNVLDLNGCSNITNSGLASLSNLRSLATLSLKESSINDNNLSSVGKLGSLSVLDLSGCSNLTDKGLEPLKSLKGLKDLYIAATKLSDKGLHTIGELTTLSQLSIEDCKNITGTGFPELGNLQSSFSLYCARSGVDPKNIKLLRFIDCLTELDISYLGVRDQDIKGIQALKSLYNLKMEGNPNFTNVGLTYVAANRTIDKLNICGSGVTDAGVGKFEQDRKRCLVKYLPGQEPRPTRNQSHGLGDE